MLIEIHIFSFKKLHLKMYGKCRPFCLCLIVLSEIIRFVVSVTAADAYHWRMNTNYTSQFKTWLQQAEAYPL